MQSYGFTLKADLSKVVTSSMLGAVVVTSALLGGVVVTTALLGGAVGTFALFGGSNGMCFFGAPHINKRFYLTECCL